MSFSRWTEPERAQWLVALVLLGALGLGLVSFIQRERSQTLARERDRLLTQVRVIDINLTQELSGINAAMLSMRPQHPVLAVDLAGNAQRSATMRILDGAMPSIRTMQMLDPQGLIVSSSRPETLGFDASHRPYFLRAQKQPYADTLYMSAPFTTSLGSYSINMARAWSDEHKHLLGVTTATLDPDYFKVLLRSVLYADDMRATLIHGDGSAFLTQPDNQVIPGSALNMPGSLFSQHLASGQADSYFEGLVPLTSDYRLVVYRTIRPEALHLDQPFYLAVSRGTSAVLAPWQQLAQALTITYVAICGLTLGAIYFFRKKQIAMHALADARAHDADAQNQRLDLALAGGNLGLFDLDMQTGRRTVNARAREIVGDGPDDPVDDFEAWSRRIHPDDRLHARLLRQTHERGETDSLNADYRVLHRQGHWVWLHSRSRITERDAQGRPLRLVGTYLDISERLVAEKNLREERLRLSNIIAGTNAGTWEHDLVNSEDRINLQYAQMLGFGVAEMTARINGDFRNVVHPDDLDQVNARWNAHLAGHTAHYEAEFRIQHQQGHWCWILSHGKVSSRDAQGRALNISGIHLDVTPVKEAQAKLKDLNAALEDRVSERTAELESTLSQLRESQQSLASSEARATIGTLVASFSHELGTPLGNSLIAASTVSAHAREFRRALSGGSLKRSDLNQFIDAMDQGAEIMESNLNRANGLLRNFRQVAADQASEQRREFNLAQVVFETVQTLRPSLKRHAHQLLVDIPPDIPMDSQPGPLGQIIINLINNAYLHAFDGIAAGTVQVRAHLDGDQLVLEVADNGVGIPAQHLDKLFEPFFSTKIGQGGTGLGMAIVLNLVTQLGGTVNLESTVGQGTTVRMRLPRVLAKD